MLTSVHLLTALDFNDHASRYKRTCTRLQPCFEILYVAIYFLPQQLDMSPKDQSQEEPLTEHCSMTNIMARISDLYIN